MRRGLIEFWSVVKSSMRPVMVRRGRLNVLIAEMRRVAGLRGWIAVYGDVEE